MKLSFNKITSGLLLAVVALSGNYARATAITGSISFGDSSTNNNDPILYSASPATAGNQTENPGVAIGITILTPTITGATGSFSGAINPIFNGNNPFWFETTAGSGGMNVGGDTIWTLTASGVNYTFTTTGSDSVTQSSGGGGNLTVTGQATITDSVSTADTTSGYYTIQANGGGATLSFATSAGVNVPDGGATALLMALGLGGIAFGVMARRRQAAKA